MFGKYRTLLIFWASLLLVSLVALFWGLRQMQSGSNLLVPPITPPLQPEDGTEGKPPVGIGGDGDDAGAIPWALILSAATAVVSAAGFVGTTFFALRADRRDTALHDLQIASLRAEIERQELEIARLRRDQTLPPEKNSK